jgi:hypothetical protein
MNTLVLLEIFHIFFIRNIYGASLTSAAAREQKWPGWWSPDQQLAPHHLLDTLLRPAY